MKKSLTSPFATKKQKKRVAELTEVALNDGFTKDDLQVVHATGADYQKWYKDGLRQFIDSKSMELVLEVDFNLPWDRAMRAGGYDSQYINPSFTPANLPASGFTGKQPVKVGLNKRNSVTTNKEWLDYLKGLGQPFVHPLVLLAIGEKFPNKQRQVPMFTLWFDDSGQLWYLYLYESAGWRVVDVRRDGLGDSWSDSCLAVSARK